MSGVRREAAVFARAFPPRWRAAHLDELLDTVEQMAPPDAAHLDAGSAIDLVRAGWQERRRTRPPAVAWLGYALFDARLEVRWRTWLRDDVDGRCYWVRLWLRRQLFVLAVVGLQTAVYLGAGRGWHVPWLLLAGPAIGLPIVGLARRRAAALAHRRHALDDVTLPPPTGLRRVG